MTSTQERNRAAYLARAIGPQEVGGRYMCGYWRNGYTVVSIDTAPSRIAWSEWSITVRWDDGRETTHCTAWDASRDRVIRSDSHVSL
jgi:hypothetical protein